MFSSEAMLNLERFFDDGIWYLEGQMDNELIWFKIQLLPCVLLFPHICFVVLGESIG